MRNVLTRKSTPDRLRFLRQVVASEYAQFPPQTVLELAEGDAWPREVKTWLATGHIERLPADAVVPIDRPVSVVGRADFEKWFRTPPGPAVEAPRLTYADVKTRFSWSDEQFVQATTCGFPKPFTTRYSTSLENHTTSAESLWRVLDVDRWENTARRLLGVRK